MPLCVHCAHPAEHLYTTYRTKSNIRLGVCPQCDRFLDPLIEHPPLVLLLDLILLKPRVFLHLLFNRGSPPLDATSTSSTPISGDNTDTSENRYRYRYRYNYDVAQLMLLVVTAETVVRVLPDRERVRAGLGEGGGLVELFVKTALVVMAETSAQHAVTLGLALLTLKWRGWYSPTRPLPTDVKRDGRQENFKPSLVTLTLLYTSLLPLLLQLFLSIWYTHPSVPSHTSHHVPHVPAASPSSLTSLLPQFAIDTYPGIVDLEGVLSQLWGQADRVWAGTRLLGGMSAGFGLRVLLPTRPWETTMVVLAGWIGASIAGRAMEEYIAS